MQKKLTALANVCIVLVALATLFNLYQQHRHGVSVPAPLETMVGKKFPKAENWNFNRKTVVLALQVGCHFCTESAPFYKQLASTSRSRGIEIIAILPQPPEEGKKYLEKLGVQVNIVQQAALTDIRVLGTPTLFIVNQQGMIEKVWQGELNSTQESQVVSSLL